MPPEYKMPLRKAPATEGDCGRQQRAQQRLFHSVSRKEGATSVEELCMQMYSKSSGRTGVQFGKAFAVQTRSQKGLPA